MTSTLTRPLAGARQRTAAPVCTRRYATLDAVTRLGGVVALWSALLLVTYWWLAGGGLQVDTAGAAFVSAGRITGLLASVLLLVQVLMMARIPLLERAYGQDQLAVLHRIVGFTSFNLMVAHILLIVVGYAGGDPAQIVSAAVDTVLNDPGMMMALAGTVCLVMVVVTSLKRARKRLRYESWHLLHLYAYLGVGLALPHQLWTGQEFLTSPAATVFWWGLWGASIASVLIWRVGVPIAANLRHQLRVAAVVSESDEVVSVYMTGRRLRELSVVPGQFFGWRFLGRPGWTRANPYSLSAAPNGSWLRITVRNLGDNSASLRQLRPGGRVLIEGPYGRLSERARSNRKVAFLGAGVGITPLRALAEGLAYERGDAVLVHRFQQQPLFATEWASLVERRGLSIIDVPGPRRAADSFLGHGFGNLSDAEALAAMVPDIADRDLFLCGPQPWIDSVRAAALAAGAPAAHIHVERFNW